MKEKIVLLHGALGSKTQFEILKNLLSKNFQFYDLDFEGHGGRITEEDYSIELFTQNTLDLFEKEEIDKANLFGYSMGGYVALNFAKKEPNLVDRIITLGTKFNWNKEIAEKEIKMLNPEKIEAKVPRFANILKERHHPVNWKEVLKKTANMMIELGEGKGLKDEEIKQIKHKILIGLGSEDKMVTKEESAFVVNMLPNGSLKIIEGFEHPIEKVDVSKLERTIIDFINKN